MVLLSKPAALELKFSPLKTCKPNTTNIPVIDLSKPDAKFQLVKACKEFGFFKVVNHGVASELMSGLESKAIEFFSLPQSEKEKAGPPDPFGYGNRRIGPNGDEGWVEYLLFKTNPQFVSHRGLAFHPHDPLGFCSAVNNYVRAVRKLGCGVLELLAEGLGLEQKNVFSKLLMDEESDSVFRLNHYPPCPELISRTGSTTTANLLGFGEHTDPQIISILRSNSTNGLQISLKDGTWVPVPPDHTSFFIIVGDSLQVMSNGRFRSVKHRVLTNGLRSRVSMIYFGGPPLKERIAPLKELMEEGEESLYKEFTWNEYKKSTYMSRLGDNRLGPFTKIDICNRGPVFANVTSKLI